jgi:katanin p60 ATPase-containing subunit A1
VPRDGPDLMGECDLVGISTKFGGSHPRSRSGTSSRPPPSLVSGESTLVDSSRSLALPRGPRRDRQPAKRAAAKQWQVPRVSYFPPPRHVDSRLRVRSFSQDFKGFWESRFGGKKEPEQQNGHANGEANGSVRKRTSDLAVYEQFEQQVWTAAPRLVL